MIRTALAIVSLIALAMPAYAEGFASDSLGMISFAMLSKNIGCTYYSDPERGVAMGCDLLKPRATTVLLYAEGKPEVYDVGGAEQDCCSEDIFYYGETWSEGPFSCASSEEGLECDNGGHGFKMSKSGVTTY